MHVPFQQYDVLHQRYTHKTLVFYRLHLKNHPSLQMKIQAGSNVDKHLGLYRGLDALPLEYVAILQLQLKLNDVKMEHLHIFVHQQKLAQLQVNLLRQRLT